MTNTEPEPQPHQSKKKQKKKTVINEILPVYLILIELYRIESI